MPDSFFLPTLIGRIDRRSKRSRSSSYDPRDMASKPERSYTWETVPKTSVHYKIPKHQQKTSQPDIIQTSIPNISPPKSNVCPGYQRDPRKRAKSAEQRNQETGQMRSNRDERKPANEHYLGWLKNEAIPACHKSIKYHEQLADTVRNDIITSETQWAAVQSLNASGNQVNTEHASRLREQMNKKLEEVLIKLSTKKQLLKDYYKQQGELSNGKFHDFVTEVRKTPCIYGMDNPNKTPFSLTQEDKRKEHQRDGLIPEQVPEPSTSPLIHHPILNNLQGRTTQVYNPVTFQNPGYYTAQGQPQSPNLPTFRQDDSRPGPSGTVLDGYDIYTDTVSGTSYAVETDHNNNVAKADNGGIVNTVGLHIEEAFDIEFDEETAALIAMGKRAKSTKNGESGSPKKTHQTATPPGICSIHTNQINFPPVSKLLPPKYVTDETSGDNEFYDLDDTVLNDGNSSSNMSTDDKAESTSGFFYSNIDSEKQKNEGTGGEEQPGSSFEAHREQNTDSPGSSCQNTPCASTPGTTTQNDTPGGNITGQLENMGTAPNPVPTQVQLDLLQVRQAVELAGGLVAQKAPDLDKMKPRVGQDLEVLNEVLDIGEQILAPDRPEEQSLHRLTSRDLLPPASTAPVPLDYEHDPNDHDFVQERRIEFLVMMKSRTNPTAAAQFLTTEKLQELFDYVRNKLDNIQIMDTVLWIRVEKATTISSMMLSTVNYPLFNAVRHEIRLYSNIEGWRIETYEKAEFVKKYGLTMYVPRDNANLCPAKLIRALMFKYPELYTRDITILSWATFTSDPPDMDPSKRSRIGDRILLFDSPSLAEKLRPYPEEKKFFLNRGFSVTIKGGHRGSSMTDIFAHSVTSNVIKSAAAEAMNNAQRAAE